MSEKNTKNTKKPAPKKDKKPSLDDLKLHLKGLKAQRDSLPLTLKAELAKIEDKRGEESRLMSAARANAIKPFEETKQEEYAKLQVVFEQSKADAEAEFNAIVNKAKLELNEAITYAEAEKKTAQDVVRAEFQTHADELFQEHKDEQEHITKKFDALAKAMKDGVESSRKKITDEIEELEKTITAIEKRVQSSRKDSSKPKDDAGSGQKAAPAST